MRTTPIVFALPRSGTIRSTQSTMNSFFHRRGWETSPTNFIVKSENMFTVFVGVGFPNPKRPCMVVGEVSNLAGAACQSNFKIYYKETSPTNFKEISPAKMDALDLLNTQGCRFTV